MRKLCLMLIITLFLLLTSGCWDLRPVEELALILAVAVDLAPDGESFIFTTTQPLYETPRGAEVQNYQVLASSLTHAETLLQLQSNKRVVAGKIILFLFGEDAWRAGMVRTIAREAYSRADMSLTAPVVCVRGRASEVLMRRPVELSRPGAYTWGFVTTLHNQGLQPSSTVFEVARSKPLNKDMWLPLLEVDKEANVIRNSGSVVFRGDLPATELTMQETIDLVTVSGTKTGATYELGKQWGSHRFALHVMHSRLQKKKREEGGQLVFDLSSRMHTMVHTVPDLSGSAREPVEEMTAVIAGEMRSRARHVIRKVQQADSDPLGLTSPSLFTSSQQAKQMRQRYRDAQINLDVYVDTLLLGGQW